MLLVGAWKFEQLVESSGAGLGVVAGHGDGSACRYFAAEVVLVGWHCCLSCYACDDGAASAVAVRCKAMLTLAGKLLLVVLCL